jgi:hypothetical protein
LHDPTRASGSQSGKENVRISGGGIPKRNGRFRPDHVTPTHKCAQQRTFGFVSIPVIQRVSRTLRSGHPFRKDPRPEKNRHGEDFRAFHRSPLAGSGTDQAGADREGPAIDQTLADAVLHSDPERRSR